MVMSYKKAKEVLGWEPKVSLKEGLSMEYEWLKKNKGRWQKMSY